MDVSFVYRVDRCGLIASKTMRRLFATSTTPLAQQILDDLASQKAVHDTIDV